jgi:effector-binding domain-containing protein
MRKLSIVSLVGLLILFGFMIFYYYKIGGFESAEMKTMNSPDYVIAGKQFNNKMNSKELGQLFNEVEAVIKKEKRNAKLCGIFYNHPNDINDTIKGFVGMILIDTAQKIPAGYSIKKIPSRKVLQAYVKSVYSAPQVYDQIEDYAEEKNLKLDFSSGYLEIYPTTNDMFVEVAVR